LQGAGPASHRIRRMYGQNHCRNLPGGMTSFPAYVTLELWDNPPYAGL
jgi:hypothetical protein